MMYGRSMPETVFTGDASASFLGLLLVVGVILLIGWVLGHGDAGLDGDDPDIEPGMSAFEVLQVRFTRGDMTADEFLAARRTLDLASAGVPEA